MKRKNINKIEKIEKVEKVEKEKIPKALREQVWLKYIGKKYENKCYVTWCQNKISVFNFHVGHNIPESKGGGIDIKNLRPLCSNCNLSMGNKYTIDHWIKIGLPKKVSFWKKLFCCIG